jgi:hypothetical protein
MTATHPNPFALDNDSKLTLFGIMKTTVDIPDEALSELMRLTHAATKRAAIVRAVDDFNQRQRMAALTKYAGTFKDFMTQDDLRTMREKDNRNDRH